MTLEQKLEHILISANSVEGKICEIKELFTPKKGGK